jgi:hypothetical protein
LPVAGEAELAGPCISREIGNAGSSARRSLRPWVASYRLRG